MKSQWWKLRSTAQHDLSEWILCDLENRMLRWILRQSSSPTADRRMVCTLERDARQLCVDDDNGDNCSCPPQVTLSGIPTLILLLLSFSQENHRWIDPRKLEMQVESSVKSVCSDFEKSLLLLSSRWTSAWWRWREEKREIRSQRRRWSGKREEEENKKRRRLTKKAFCYIIRLIPTHDDLDEEKRRIVEPLLSVFPDDSEFNLYSTLHPSILW